MTLNIVHVYKDYAPILGGIENHLQILAEAQAAQGHRVTVLVTNPAQLPTRESRNGVTLIRARRLATLASTPLSLDLPRQLAQLQPDITHLHFPYPLGDVSQWLMGNRWLSRQAQERPFLFTYHSDIIKQQTILRLYRPLLARILNQASQIIATSDRYIDSSPFLRPHAEKCVAIPFAVDTERFRPDITPLFAPVDRPTLLFVGRHRHYKGVDILLQAMPSLNARLLVAGSGPLQESWQALAASLGLADKVTFVGDVPDVDLAAFYASGDLFVLPAVNRAEAFGIVLQEAMAAGLPCVTSELGTGTSFLVRHNENGFVVPPGDVAALTAVLQTLIANPTLRQQMGAAGRTRALHAFQLPQMVERITAVYRKILKRT